MKTWFATVILATEVIACLVSIVTSVLLMFKGNRKKIYLLFLVNSTMWLTLLGLHGKCNPIWTGVIALAVGLAIRANAAKRLVF